MYCNIAELQEVRKQGRTGDTDVRCCSALRTNVAARAKAHSVNGSRPVDVLRCRLKNDRRNTTTLGSDEKLFKIATDERFTDKLAYE